MSKTKKAKPTGGSDILESPEALAEQLSKTEEFLDKNRNVVFFIGGIIGVVLLAFFGYRYYITNQDEIAQRELFQAVYYFEADSLGKALNGDGLNYGFLDVISEYSGTKAANLASFYAGATYLQLSDYESALRYLENFGGDDLIVQARAYSLIGDAHAELKDFGSAAEYYEKAADYQPNEQFSPIYLQKAAIAYEKLNQLDDALKAYDQIVNKYFESTIYQDAKKHKARLEMKAKS